VALPAFARRTLLLSAGQQRSISPAGRALSNKPAAAACDGRMMGQTDRRQTDGRPTVA